MITKGYQDVPMSRRRAQLLEEYASKLADMLEAAPDDKDLAEWVQSKIDRAAAAIQSAYHYLDQDDESELEKAAGHKYTHRKLVGKDPKTGRARYRYYYAEHHGGGITSAKFEAGSAFKLTFKGRRGHFHIKSVEGDKVLITHDSRPNMAPVEIEAVELRALLKKQHGAKLEAHTEKLKRKVDQLKRDPSPRRSSLGLALHRLRQAADKAGISLPEQYQRKPQKTRAPVVETAREDNFETMPEAESAEELRSEFKRKIQANEGDFRLYVKLFDAADYSETLANVPDSELFEHPITQELFSLTGGYPNDPVYIYNALKELPPEYTKRLYTELLRRYQETGQRSISEGASVGILQAHQHHFERKTAPTAPPPMEEKEHPLLGLKTLDLDPQQARSSYRNISHTAEQRAESERREWAQTLDQLEAQAESEIQAGASREEVEKRYQKLAQRLLRTKQSVISARAQTASSAITGAGQFNARQAQKRQQTLERREAEYRQALQKIKDTQPPAQTAPRDQLTSTAQQIIEDANQDHDERHEEHQEITRFELGEHVHTKTGAKLFTAKQTERVDRDEYFRRVEIAKKYKGRYERRYVRGFVFKNAEDARAFALEVEGAAQPEESAETVTPHEDHPSADNFETMPEVESAEDRTRGDLKSKQQALDLLRRSEQEDELKGRWRAKGAGTADKALMRAVREILKRPDPTQDLDERDRQRLRDSLFSLEEAQRPNKYMNAQRSKEKRQSARATIKEILDQQVRMVSEALNPTPTPQTPAPEPTTPSTRPANVYGRATKKLVDQALSTEPTDFDPNRSGIDLPTKGDLREMLSQEQRLERAKEDLRSTGAPNFLGQKNPIQDIMDALDRYLNGPYVELEQKRLREMERGLKIALRDSKGEELEQVKDETARFWREWGGEYKRLQDEFAKGRTEGEALRNIKAFIPKRALTPEINQQLDQMERELDQRPITGHDIARWIGTRDTNKATRDRQPTTPREQLTETAREVVQGADNFETMPEVESAGTPKSLLDDIRSEITVERFIREGRRREDTAEREVKKLLKDLDALEQGLLNREYSTEAKRAKAQEILSRRIPKIAKQFRAIVSANLVQPQLSGGAGQRQAARYERARADIGVAVTRANEEYRRAIKELDRLEDRQPQATPREQLTETAREARPSVEHIRAREALKRARGTQTRIKQGNRADKLTATGRRARASIKADKGLIDAVERIINQDYREIERPLPSDINQRTPQQNNFAKLRGALNGFKSAQTLTRGSWTDDHKSLQKKRIKARDQLDEALKELETRSLEELQTQIQVSIEDLPPKGQRTAEDAKRFFGEPSKNEAIKRVTYERDGHIVTGPASGRGKGKFRYDLSLPRERFKNEPLLATAQSSNEIGSYDTLDEALTAAINQYEPSDQIIDQMIESAKEERERTARRMGATPREQLTETAREVTQGADNFETISDGHKEFIQNKTREFSRELMSGLIYEKTKRGKIKSLQRQGLGDMERALVKLALSALRGKEVTNSSVKQFIASKITGERAEETQGRLSALLSVGDTVEDKQDILYKQALIEAANHIDEIAQGLSVHDKDFSEAEHRAVKQRAAYLRALSAEIETEQPTPTTPARQALTETAERVTADQTAEQAATRATPRPSEATLRGSGELDETVRANLRDRAQFLLRMPEDTTKTGRRSKRQKARDGESLLIHRRLQSDAQERLGPTAPRFADYSQLIGMPRADQSENAETRAQFRTALKDAIRELEQATSGRAESVTPVPPKKISPQIRRDVNKISREISEDHDLLQGLLKNHPDREFEIATALKRLQHRTYAVISDLGDTQRYIIERRLEGARPQLTREVTELYRRGQAKEALTRIVESVKGVITPEAKDTGNTARERREAKKIISRLDAYSSTLSSTIQKSARPLITYRAQLIQTVERLAA